jgi:hypothetical protein
MTTTTNDDDGGDGATGNDNENDNECGNDGNGEGTTGDGSWMFCRKVLKNSQTDHVLTIVAHTMTAKLISEEGCSTLCLHVCWGEWESTCLAEDRQTTKKKSWRSKTCGSDVASRSSQERET